MQRRNFLKLVPAAAGAIAALLHSNSQIAQPDSQKLTTAYGRHSVEEHNIVYFSRPEPLSFEELKQTGNYLVDTSQASHLFSLL